MVTPTYTEETVIDQINILEDGQMQVRAARRVYRDGDRITETYHRHVVVPGASLTEETQRVRDVANLIHTPAVVAAYRAAQAAASI